MSSAQTPSKANNAGRRIAEFIVGDNNKIVNYPNHKYGYINKLTYRALWQISNSVKELPTLHQFKYRTSTP